MGGGGGGGGEAGSGGKGVLGFCMKSVRKRCVCVWGGGEEGGDGVSCTYVISNFCTFVAGKNYSLI